MLWRLKKLPYGICEASRQWAKAIESWMLEAIGLERVFGVSQLYVRRRQDGSVQLILAKVTDDFFVAGQNDDVRSFMNQMKSRFEMRKGIIDDEIMFNGGLITRNESSDLQLSM